MKYFSVLLTTSIFAIALLGDIILAKSRFSSSDVFRAIADNLVHASIGFLSSILFFSNDQRISNHALSYNVLFCTLISSLIDIDHIFVARSLQWKDLTTLKQRGLFHCTSFWLCLTVILFMYSIIANKVNIYVLTWMLVIAYTTHHIRDANRRGLWLYPFGSTPPLSKLLYLSLITIMPLLFSYIYRNTINIFYKHNILEHVHEWA